MNEDRSEPAKAAVAGQVDRGVRPATAQLVQSWLDEQACGLDLYVDHDSASSTTVDGQLNVGVLAARIDALVRSAVSEERERCANACRRPVGWLSAAQQQVSDEIRAAIEGPNVELKGGPL